MAKKAAATTTDKDKALELAIKQIQKDFGEGSIMKLGENTAMNIGIIPTGSLNLDNDLEIVLEGFYEYLQTITPEENKESLINLLKNQNIEYTEEQLVKLLNTPTDINKVYKIISAKFNEVSKLTQKRVQNIQFLVLVIGTLIWGYGDLINKLYS